MFLFKMSYIVRVVCIEYIFVGKYNLYIIDGVIRVLCCIVVYVVGVICGNIVDFIGVDGGGIGVDFVLKWGKVFVGICINYFWL